MSSRPQVDWARVAAGPRVLMPTGDPEPPSDDSRVGWSGAWRYCRSLVGSAARYRAISTPWEVVAEWDDAARPEGALIHA
jgi:hypothetical protein